MAGIIEIKLEQKNFLTIDERRRTLHREDAIQRNSTRSVDEDPSKSINASNEKNQTQPETTITTSVQGQNSVIDTEIAVPGNIGIHNMCHRNQIFYLLTYSSRETQN
jgi:hypothetical protein